MATNADDLAAPAVPLLCCLPIILYWKGEARDTDRFLRVLTLIIARYILDILGPFYASQNDAKIMHLIVKNLNGPQAIMSLGDICIVDRGFRDVQSFLEDSGYTVLMPALKGKQAQLTTEESRQITKIRWVVEAIHGILGKKYNLLHHQVDNKFLPKIATYTRVAAFLQNKFGKRLSSDTALSAETIMRMKSRLNVQNTLALEVESEGCRRKKVPFQNISSAELEDFPVLTEEDLKLLVTGTYQLSQTVSYLAEIMDDDSNINLHFLKTKNGIARFKIKSRQLSCKTYSSHIAYIPYSSANGNRTIGCCSHVAAIICYVSYARYLSDIVRPAEMFSGIFSTDGVMPVINEDSDED